MCRSQEQLYLASKTLSKKEIDDFDESAPIEWNRWAVYTGNETVRIQPGLPDLPILFEPESGFQVSAGEEVRILVRLPLSVVVQVPDEVDPLLAEFPTEKLSHAWFGESEDEELCYSVSTSDSSTDDSTVMAPIQIRNDGAESLDVSRLCLRVSGLSIFRSEGKLWANETLIHFQGGRQPSKVSVRKGPPLEAVAADLIAPPRDCDSGSVVGRTVRSIRRWASDFLDLN
ncbi:MAG: hypothetical protein P1U86_19020 [Verrucomicrobiales bacterium]|nr:hypothetical protein [Verrucomicrobiales bacterium]